jgi:predicted nucleic acid-binding protein
MLLDSNIIIYASKPDHAALRQFITERNPAISVISNIEVLGYHRLKELDRILLEQFFRAAEVLPLSEAVAHQAIRI